LKDPTPPKTPKFAKRQEVVLADVTFEKVDEPAVEMKQVAKPKKKFMLNSASEVEPQVLKP